jgi:hypothetical protein
MSRRCRPLFPPNADVDVVVVADGGFPRRFDRGNGRGGLRLPSAVPLAGTVCRRRATFRKPGQPITPPNPVTP